MKTATWTRLTLMAVVMLVAGAFAVLACGPAAPTQPAGGGPVVAKEDPTEEPTPTRDPECYELQHPTNPDHVDVVCPEPGPRNIEHNLRSWYNNRMEEKATRQARSEAVDVVIVHVRVEVATHAELDAVEAFLRENTDGWVSRYNNDNSPEGGRTFGYVSIELLPTIAAMAGVTLIEEVQRAQPAGSNLQGPPAPTILGAMGVDDWRTAGVTGAGVGVAIIDYDFRNFRTRIGDPSAPGSNIRFFCWGQGPTTTDFSACEVARLPLQANAHGTDVAETFLSVAPDVTLYISNADNEEQLEQAVDWLTMGDQDNSATDTDYERDVNDDFDVKVINHSKTYMWDGPGDGTSVLDSRGMRSSLNSLRRAVSRGVLWVNAAGNGAQRTRYIATHPSFNLFDYLSAGSGDDPCHYVTLSSNKDYWFQLRWSGDPGGTDVDLGLHLYGPYDVTGTEPRLIKSADVGRIWERLNVKASEIPVPGTYCLSVKRKGSGTPGWIQLQSRDPYTTLSVGDGTGSIENPAESSSEGMLAVGAVRGPANPMLQAFSARGPVPGIPLRTKPDVTSFDTAVLSGTSYAAPLVAGQAALVAQTFGPSVTPRFLWHLFHFSYRDNVANDLARLPKLEAPANVQVSNGTCARRGLLVGFAHPSLSAQLVSFEAHATQSFADGTSGAVFEGTGGRGVHHVDIGTDRGAYDVTMRACARGVFCGPWSSPAVRFTTAANVCVPEWFRAVPGDGKATLRWNPDPDASGYEVDAGQGTSSVTVVGEEHVIEDLTNDTSYLYRVRSLGPGGPSDWVTRSVVPAESVRRQPKVENLRVDENVSRRFPGLSLKWDTLFGSAVYEIRIMGGGADDWRRLPFQPVGWDSPYSARFFVRHERMAGPPVTLSPVGEAIIAGLIPGTEYHLAVRAARERNSDNKLHRSPWSEVLTVTTPGVRPAGAPGDAAAPALKAPPEDLMAVVNGTTVNLTWTATTNPNYTSQRLLRRLAGVSPVAWTEIPLADVDVTSYTDTGLTSGVTYRYRVRAYKDSGSYGEEKGGFADAVIP